jgi:copper homeostasis protein
MIPATLLFEACVDTVEAAIAAEAAGAARIEACDFRADGGLTPSPALVRACRTRLGIPVCALVRPRPGGFVNDRAGIRAILDDAAAMREAGADALVAGGLTGDGAVDAGLMGLVIDGAGGVPVVFHRAFDRATDRAAALETLIRLGIRRVLTSGGAPTAGGGVSALAQLVRQSAGRITILAGGGVTPDTVVRLVRDGGVREIHASSPPDGMKARAIVAALRSATPPDVDPALR